MGSRVALARGAGKVKAATRATSSSPPLYCLLFVTFLTILQQLIPPSSHSLSLVNFHPIPHASSIFYRLISWFWGSYSPAFIPSVPQDEAHIQGTPLTSPAMILATAHLLIPHSFLRIWSSKNSLLKPIHQKRYVHHPIANAELGSCFRGLHDWLIIPAQIREVKEKIFQEKGWDVAQQKLIYSGWLWMTTCRRRIINWPRTLGKILQDANTIVSYNIEEKGFIVCMVSKVDWDQYLRFLITWY
jgi:hypothetical protein